METDLLDTIREHLNFKKNARENLNPNFFTEIGFTERELTNHEKTTLNIGELSASSWNRIVGDEEITVIHHVKSEDGLIMPKPDEIHVHLITKNIKTNEEKREKYSWCERLLPILKEELL